MEEVDRLVLRAMPHFMAIHYRRMLEAGTWSERINEALCVFELGLRTLALGLVSQYLIRDAELFSDPDLNTLLLKKLPVATLGTWQEILFTALRAYENRRGTFFMPELYDFFWDTSTTSHRPRPGIQKPFTRLVQIRSDLANKIVPVDEAGWQKLGKETLGLLRTLLGQFAFWEQYELIRVTGRDEEGWRYECYSGLRIMAGEAALRVSESEGLKEGWFYLSKDRQRFLELHPLLIFWGESPQQFALVEGARGNVALYESFVRDAVRYLMTAALWDHISTSETVGDFARRVFYALEKVKIEQLETSKLNWWQLQRLAQQISRQRMEGVREKYRADLYLQRDATKLAFDEFLASAKACFVLTGKSGVGKSNFLLSLTEEYHAEHPEICLLMYNGATLNPMQNLTAIVTADFESRLRLTGREDEEGIDNIWLEIERVEGIEDRKVVLVIDAVNENMDGRALLRQINELVENSPWKWLKVIVTSRPEAWRNIKRRVRLSEGRYYREMGKEELGFEMEGFTYSQELRPFERDELPRVYEKYCQAYDLRTPYTELQVELREVLRDPLMLRLIADVYQGQEIPKAIKVRDIYKDYIDALIKTERMEREDVWFLEEELMPLVIGAKQYGNTIPGAVVATAQTSDGLRLYDLIHGEEVLSSGRAVNASYRNLADAEILEQRGEPTDYEIGFRYERFYDYFAGKRLYELAHAADDRRQEYLSLITKTRKRAFLWGGVKNALLRELVEGKNYQLISELAQTEDQLLKETLVVVLTEYGQESEQREEAHTMARDLLAVGRKPTTGLLGWLKEAWLRDEELSLEIENARKIAVEVAEGLEFLDVLECAVQDSASAIRNHACRHVFYLWRKEPEKGYQVLDELTKSLRGKLGIPRIGAIESLVGISLLILIEIPRDEEERICKNKQVHTICKKAIEQLLYVRQDQPLREIVLRRFREVALSVLVGYVFGLLRDLPMYVPFHLNELAHFFELPSREKQYLGRLLPYIDPGRYDFEIIESDLRHLVKKNEALTAFILGIIATSHGIVNTERALPLIEYIFDLTYEVFPDGLCCPVILTVLGNIADLQEEPNEQVFRLFRDCRDRWFDASKGQRKSTASGHIYPATFLDAYIELSYKTYGTADLRPWTQCYLRAKETDDTELKRLIVYWDLGNLRARGLHLAALQAAKWVVEQEGKAAFDSDMIGLLTRLRVYAPDKVADFLVENDAPEEVRQEVERIEIEENIGGELLYRQVAYFFFTLLQDQFLLDELVEMMERMLDSQSMEAWGKFVVKRVVNLIYGGKVFKA